MVDELPKNRLCVIYEWLPMNRDQLIAICKLFSDDYSLNALINCSN